MSDSRQLEREAEETRLQLTRTLGELRERITPGQLLDQAIDYARDSGGGEFVRNLGRQATANPFSVCLIGAGLAWLALSNGRPDLGSDWLNQKGERPARRRPTRTEPAQPIYPPTSESGYNPSRASEDRDQTDEAAGPGIGERLSGAAEVTAGSLGEMASGAADVASAGYETAKSGIGAAAEAAGEAASSAAGTASNAIGNGWDFLRRCADEPAVIAGIGVAIGAAVGAALPSSQFEDRLVGETSDQLKDQARDFAHEQFEQGKSKAKAAVHEAVEDAGDRLHAEAPGEGQDARVVASAGPTPGAAGQSYSS